MEDIVRLTNVTFAYPGEETPVIRALDLLLPGGVTSVMGQNGTGKSTLLLLAGGRLLPQTGAVEILGRDSRMMKNEEERNEYVSFVYQNMEFETEEPVKELLEFIYQHGFHSEKSETFVEELVEVFELADAMGKQLQNLSKGEMQRAIMAFSLLYGSAIIMMDEPLFALEDYQKTRVMDFMTSYARSNSIHLFYSIHELAISEKYSDSVILFSKDGSIKMGNTEDIITDENIESAYELPRGMLHQKEHLYRENLMRLSAIRPGTEIGEN